MYIVLVDDDVEFSHKLERDVKSHFRLIDEKINFIVINDTFEKIKDIEQIDLIFLDIDLNFEMNGINIGSYLKYKFPKIIIVFVSMHEEFVFPALSIVFFQFIRKKQYDIDIIKVLNQIEFFLRENLKKICINMEGRDYVIRLSDIRYIMSIGHDLYINTYKKEYLIHSSLKKFMDRISFVELVQIERSLVVNLNFIKRMNKTNILTLNDEEYSVGRKYQDELVRKYEEFLLKWLLLILLWLW